MTGAPLIYDAHELETEAYGIGSFERRLSRWTERLLIRWVDRVVTVCDSIADWYEEEYGVELPDVVKNVPDWDLDLISSSDTLRLQFRIPEDALIFLYQGGLSPGRGIHAALKAFGRLHPDRHLVLMGFGVLEDEIRKVSAASDYVHFREAVPPNELAEYTSSADIGLCLIEPVCLSNYFCLPNKLFEYIGSGIPVIVSDLPEQRALIEAYDCGWVVGDDENALGELLASIDRDAVNRKATGVRAARRSLSWSKEAEILKNCYRALGIGASKQELS
jgi:glycosyltransferase involved in cell wall biosynthesis